MEKIEAWQRMQSNKTITLAQELEELTGLESRVTILGYVQRGGIPSARDRMLATGIRYGCCFYDCKEKMVLW